MKRKRKKQIVDYVSYLQGELDLRDWYITIIFADQTLEECGGKLTCLCYFGRKVADITVPKDFHKKCDESEIGGTLLHELLHCHFAALTCYDENSDEFLTTKQYNVNKLAFKLNMEYCVDGIAMAWYKNLEPFKWT